MRFIEFNTVIYAEFVKVLYTAIIEKEGPEEKFSALENQAWDAPIFKEKVRGITEQRKQGLSHDHFSRKVSDCPPNKVLFVSLKEPIFTKALHYVDEKYSLLKAPAPMSDVDLANYKLERFITDHNLIDLNKRIEAANTVYEKFIEAIGYNDNTLQLNGTKGDELESEFSAVSETVKKFYGHLNTRKEYMEAWELLSEDFQLKKWKKTNADGNTIGDLTLFKNGYANTTSIVNPQVFNHQVVYKGDNLVVSCLVYYKDKISIRQTEEFGKGGNFFPASKVNSFAEKVHDLTERFKMSKITGIEKIDLSMFFKSTLSEHLRVKCNLSESNMNELFADPEEVRVNRLTLVQLVKTNGKWLIDATEDEKITPLR